MFVVTKEKTAAKNWRLKISFLPDVAGFGLSRRGKELVGVLGGAVSH